MRLFALLSDADALISQMRALPPSVVVTPASDRPRPPVALPSAAPDRRPGGGRGVTVSAVPLVLLGLGALCVLVAASLFLPFAWELLGVTGRTVVLVLLTLAAAAAADTAGRRGLRATTEALGLVALGLLTFDLLGARSSGWFGDMSGAAFSVLVGVVLVAAGTAATLRLRGTAATSFVGGEAVAVTGSLLVLAGGLGLTVAATDVRLAVLVPALGALAVLSARLRASRRGLDSMGLATGGHGLVAGTAWLMLLLVGLVGLVDGRLTWAALWPTGSGPTLLVAGLYAAVPALLPRLGAAVRTGSLSVALLPWTLALTAPSYDEGNTWRVLALLAVLGACLAVAPAVARPWRLALLPTGALSALAASVLVAPLAATAVAGYAAAVSPPWQGAPGGYLVAEWGTGALGSPLLLPLVAAALAAAVVVVSRHGVGGGVRPSAAGQLEASALPVVLGVCGAMVLLELPVWTLLALLLAATAVAAASAWRSPSAVRHGAVLGLGALALLLSWHDEWLTLAACAVLLLVALAHHLHGTGSVPAGAGVAIAPLLAGVLWSGGAVLGAQRPWVALVVLLVVAALVIVRGVVGVAGGVAGVELGAALTALAVIEAGVSSAPVSAASAWLAVFLTVAGVATTVVALTRPERHGAGWAGGLLLAAASWVRLADLGVGTPEAYTLPSALALLVVGWWRTRRDPAASSLRAWSPGLGLALVPSLLWSLADPLSWRALLLGIACLVLAVAGAQARVAAPFVWGAGVGGALVLWEVGPPALAMSAWLVTGLAGAALLVLGASWERRVRDARAALGYLRALR